MHIILHLYLLASPWYQHILVSNRLFLCNFQASCSKGLAGSWASSSGGRGSRAANRPRTDYGWSDGHARASVCLATDGGRNFGLSVSRRQQSRAVRTEEQADAGGQRGASAREEEKWVGMRNCLYWRAT